MAEPIISVEKMKIIYNKGKSNEVRSLDGVDVQIFPHEYVIIHGPSGCGKSTLMYSIGGFQIPTEGEVTVEGKQISKMSAKEIVTLHQTGVGMIFQAFYLIPTLTILDNVCLPRTFMGEDLRTRREAGMNLLQRFGIMEQAYKFPSQLSGGQKQRVAIARSLVNNPQIILADEPVGNLDSESARNVLQILKDLNEVDKKTIIMVTHNPEHLYYGDRIIHMKDGKIIGEEVNKEKRPLDFFEKARKEAVADEKKSDIENKKDILDKENTQEKIDIPNELKLLMRTFKGLDGAQLGALLVPFKAKQLLSHVLADLNDEQLSSAENILKELLFKNIAMQELSGKLDMSFEKGGSNWNKTRAKSFSARVAEIIDQVDFQMSQKQENKNEAVLQMCEYLQKTFNLHLDQAALSRFQSYIKLRFDNKIDNFELKKQLDLAKLWGGVGLNKITAEKLVRELEVIMLLKYSG
jgi:putative ABC transport system ATP-binding protein